MAYIARSIDVAEPVAAIEEQWTVFEATPRYLVGEAVARLRWRAEVLTFEPVSGGTRVTFRIDYEPSAADAGLSGRLEDALEDFRSFLAERRAGAGGWAGLPGRGLRA